MEILKKLMMTQSVSGREHKVAQVISGMLEGYVDDIYTDNMGNLIAYKKGTSENPKKLMFAGHMDEIGFIVTHIEDGGFLRVNAIGGIDWTSAAYSVVKFENGSLGVIMPESGGGLSGDKFCIDIGAKDKKAAEKLVNIGDFCSVVPHVERLAGGYYAGRPFDDKIGCAIMVRAAKELKSCPNDVYFAFTVQEEVGCRGSKTSAFRIMPDYSVAFDVTGTGDALKSRPMAVKLGGGAAVKVKDSSVICDMGFVSLLSNIAKENKIPYQLEILEGGGTDTSSMQMAGCGSRATAISVPSRYIHSNVETISKKDYDACVSLTVKLIETDLAKI